MDVSYLIKKKKDLFFLLHISFYEELMSLILVEWWNWQTRMIKGHVPQGVRVQVPPRPPIRLIASNIV